MALQPTTTAVPVGLLDMTYAQPSAATGYPGGSTLVDALAAAYAANPAAFAAPAYSFNVSSNKGNPTGQVSVSENTPIALVNNRTGELVYSGVGVDAAKQIETLAADLTKAGGNKATWSVYTAPAGATDSSQFAQVAYEKPNKGVLGTVADIALPVLGTLLALPTGGLSLGAGLAGTLGSAAAAGAAGAAGGSALSSALQGRSLEDTLLRAGLSGAGSFAGGSLLGKLASTAPNVANQTVQEAAKAAAENVAAAELARQGISLGGDIIVNRALTSGVGAALGGAGAGALPSAFESAFTDMNGNNVMYATQPAPVNPGVVAGGVIAPVVSVTGDEMVLTGQKPPTTNTAGSTAGSTLPTAEEILVTPKPDLGPASIAGALGSLPGSPTANNPNPNLNINDILKYIGGATTIGGGLLDLIKGGSGATAGTAVPYTSLLGPAPNLGRGALTPYTGDYEKYAFGPEWNFFGGQQPA